MQLTDEVKEQIIKDVSLGMSSTLTARMNGINPNRIRREFFSDSEFGEKLRAALRSRVEPSLVRRNERAMDKPNGNIDSRIILESERFFDYIYSNEDE